MTMGSDADEFYLPRFYPQLPYIYMLPYSTLPILDGKEKLYLIPVPNGFGYPRLISSP